METITPPAFTRCGLAWGKAALARQGWAGEKVACLSILRECVPVVPHVGTFEVLLCQNGCSAACQARKCCYRSSAGVASKLFILLMMFSCQASPGHRAGRLRRQANEVQIGIRSRPA